MSADDVVLTITFNPETRRTELSGPIDNRMVCYGMLAMGHEILLKRAILPNESSIVVPKMGLGFPGPKGM